MNKLEKMRQMLKQSKFEIFRYIRKKQLYKPQARHNNKISLTEYSKDQLYYSVIEIESSCNDFNERLKVREEKRKKSVPEKKTKAFPTSALFMREKRNTFVEYVKNGVDLMPQPVQRFGRFSQATCHREQIRTMQSKRREQVHPFKIKVQSLSENVAVVRKRQSILSKKISELRIKRMKKVLKIQQKPLSPQRTFKLCGWQTREQQTFS